MKSVLIDLWTGCLNDIHLPNNINRESYNHLLVLDEKLKEWIAMIISK